MTANFNENFHLLDLSDNSSSISDVPEVVVAKPKKKKFRKKFRGSQDRKADENKYNVQCCGCYARNASIWFSIVFIICWITTLTSVTYVLHGQLLRLDANVKEVVASNQGVPEALQKCHSFSQGLKQNQTQLAIQLNNFRQQLENFTLQFMDIKNGLNQVQQRLKENPDLVNIPQQVTILKNSVAEFGSQMKDVATTVQSLKEQNTKYVSISSDVVQNITALQTSVAQILQNNITNDSPNTKVLFDEKQEMNNLISQLRTNVSHINETLTQGLQWVVDDQHKDHQIIIGLQEMNQSIFARVSNLEGICSKAEHDQAENVLLINNLSQNVSSTINKLETSDTAVLTLQAQVHDLTTRYTEQNVTLNELKDNLIQLTQNMHDTNPSQETPSNNSSNVTLPLPLAMEPTTASSSNLTQTNASVDVDTSSIPQPVQPNVKPKTLSIS